MAAPATHAVLIRAALPFVVVVAAACGDREPETPATTEPVPTPAATLPASYVDSVRSAFASSPDAVLDRMTPASDPEDVRVAAALLETTAGEGRIRYAEYLAGQGERSVPYLAFVGSNSQDWNARLVAIQTLGKMRATSALPVVADQLSHENSWVRIAAAHALGEIGGDRSVRALSGALGDSTDTVVAAIAVALGKSGSREALTAVADLLDHANPRVRGSAVAAVGRLGDSEDVDLVDPLLTDPDDGVRFKARQAIDRLAAKRDDG